MAAYALYLGKGDFRDGSSRLLTQISAGYFQPDLGGENIPAVDADVSVLDGGRPLFEPLYDWYLSTGGAYKLAFGPKVSLIFEPLYDWYLSTGGAYKLACASRCVDASRTFLHTPAPPAPLDQTLPPDAPTPRPASWQPRS